VTRRNVSKRFAPRVRAAHWTRVGTDSNASRAAFTAKGAETNVIASTIPSIVWRTVNLNVKSTTGTVNCTPPNAPPSPKPNRIARPATLWGTTSGRSTRLSTSSCPGKPRARTSASGTPSATLATAARRGAYTER